MTTPNRHEAAILFWGHAFYSDEDVLLMSYEQQGIYLRLIWLAKENRGLPADPAKIAKMLALPEKRFLRDLWPAIAPCWVEQGGRLVQPRLEEELERRAATQRPATDPAAGGDRSERMRQLAHARWAGKRTASDAVHASPHDATPHTTADAARNAQRIEEGCEPHMRPASLPPAPPSVQTKKNPKRAHASARTGEDAKPHANADAANDAAPHADGAPPTGASAARAEAEAEPDGAQKPKAKDDGKAPVAELTSALMKTRYRSEAGDGNQIRRRAALAVRAAILTLTGLEAGHVAELWKLALAKSNSDPGALLAHWLDGNTWREVLDEQASKAKQAEASSRQRENAELVDDLYASPPSAAAGDVVAQVLAGVNGASGENQP